MTQTEKSRSELYHPRNEIDLEQENSSWAMIGGFATKKGAKILDVGCACGDLGYALKKRDAGITLCGLELDAGSIEMAKRTGAYGEIVQADLDRIDASEMPQWLGTFDYVICGDVLEHLRDPGRTLAHLKRFLKPDGALIASIPNVAHMYIKAQLLLDRFNYTPNGLLDQTHIHLFTSYSIATTLAEAGFAVRSCRFSMFGQNTWYSYDPWPLLSRDERFAIFSDWQSFVGQFVLIADQSGEAPKVELAEGNLDALAVNERTAPDYIREYRAALLQSLGPAPFETILSELAVLRGELSAARSQIANLEALRLELERAHGQLDEMHGRLDETTRALALAREKVQCQRAAAEDVSRYVGTFLGSTSDRLTTAAKRVFRQLLLGSLREKAGFFKWMCRGIRRKNAPDARYSPFVAIHEKIQRSFAE